MSEVNANINIGIDSSQALASLRTLQNQISSFNKNIVTSNAQAMAAQKTALSGLTAQIGATKAFSTSIVNVESSVSRLGNAIDKNKLGLGEYFRYGVASSKNFGKVFAKEHTQMTALATERVKRLQTQYIALGAAQNGVTRAMAVRPLALFNADTAIAAQRQQLFSKLLNDGSTSLINFGKNTQWAGRQLMVGFTVPLTIFGGMAGKIFMDLERQVVNFRRVYGDAMTPAGETDQMVKEIQDLGKEFTKYGITVKDTVGLAGDIAATGAQGADLIAATAQSTRLATLGMIEMDQAMTATISLQTAFKLSNEELAQSVNFLNAVENQTVLSLGDVTEAIPKVAPVIMGLGGNVEDLAYFLTAMREGGVNAAEGANALKSGLASLINPTKGAREQLEKVGIDINSIISTNKGDIRATVQEFGSALMTLDKFGRQQTLAKVFGKYQFARLGALFENISTEGSQASRVIDLAGESIEGLAGLADKELGAIEESIGMKFTGALERLKLAIAPIGEMFLKIATPILEVVSKILDKFNDLSPGIKQFITILVAGVGVVVPTVIMLIGLFGNFIGQAIKGFAMFNNFFNRIRGGGKDLSYLAGEQLDATAAAATLEGQTTSLTAALNVQRGAVGQLARAYGTYVAAAGSAASGLPQGFRGRPAKAMATGGFVAGSGNKDTEPALLTPGEFVMNRGASQKFGPILDAMNRGSITQLNQGDRLAQTPFGDFSTQRTDSVSGVTGLLSQLVNLSDTDTRLVTAGLRQLEESNRLNKSTVDRLIKDLNVLPQTLSTAMAKSHVLEQPKTSVSGAEVRRMVSETGGEITAPAFNRLLNEAERMPQGSLNIFPKSDLVADLPRQINEGLKQGISSTNFADALEEGGVDKWSKTVRLSGVNAQEAAPQFDLFDKKIQELARSSNMIVADFDNAEKGIVSFGTLSRQAMEGLEGEIPLVKQSFETLESRFRTFQVTLNSEMIPTLERLGYTIESISRNGDELYRISGAGMEEPIDIRKRGQRESARGSYRGVNEAESLSQYLGSTSIDAINRGTGSNSESKKAQKAADNVVDGFSNQIRRGIPEAQSAALGLGNAATQTLENSASRVRRGASRPQGPSGMSSSEMNARIKAEERAARKVRGAVVREGKISPLALRAGEESTRIANIGNAQKLAMQEEINRAHDLAIKENEKLTEQTSGTSKEMSKSKGYAKKFGGALKSGSLKLTGAMFAMDGVVFAASMMNNSMGEFAQKIMPAVFAVQGIAMMLPMLMSPLGLAAAALGTVAAGMLYLNKQSQDASKKAQDFSAAMVATTASVKSIADFYGNKTVVQKEANRITKRDQGVTSAETEKAKEFIQTETGQSFYNGLQIAMKSIGSSSAARQFAANLGSMVLQGSLTGDQARAISLAMGEQLKNKSFGISVNGSLKRLLGPNDENLLKDPLSIAILIDKQTVNSIDSIKESLTEAGGAAERLNSYGITVNADSFYGSVVSGLRGFLSEDTKNAQIQLEALGGTVGGTYAQSYDNLAAAKQRYSDATKKAAKVDKEDAEGKKKAKEEADLARKSLEYLTNSIEVQKAAYINLFRAQGSTGQNTSGAQAAMLKGMEQSLGSSFENDPMMKAAFQAISGDIGSQSGELRFNIYAELQSGGIDPLTLQMFTSMYENPTAGFSAYIALTASLSGDSAAATRFIQALSGNSIDEEISKKIVIDAQLMSDKKVLAYTKVLEKIQLISDKDLRTRVIVDSEGMSIKELKQLSLGLDVIESLPESLKTSITIESIGKKSLTAMTKAYSLFQSKKNVTKQAEVAFGTTDPKEIKRNLDAMGMSLEDFEKKPSSFKMAVMAIAELNLKPPMFMTESGGADWLEKEKARLMAILNKDFEDTSKTTLTPNTTPVPEDDPKGDAGSKTRSFLEELIAETEANLQMFPGMLDKIKNKFPAIPQQIIEAIGGGEEGIKKAQELLNANKKKVKELLAKYRKATIAETLRGMQDEIKTKKRSGRAESMLIDQGFSEEDAKSLASNTDYVFTLLEAKAGRGGKSVKEVVAAFREFIAVTKEAKDPVDELNSAWSEYSNAVDMAFDVERTKVENEFAEKRYGAEQKTTKEIQKQIDANEELIQIQQDIVDGKQEEIDDYERINDLTSQNIDDLQKQDELRNRVSDALSHELDLMGQQETKISEAYDKRISALDKVQELNNRILQQQKDQLGISQALSEGDIYAATAAAQAMRQNQAKDAQDQAKTGLEQGKQNAIDSLRTSEGLTREEAERQIADIKEQSYQASLMIRMEEDKIYANSLEVRRLTNEIYNINEKMIEPLTNQNNQHSRILENHQKALDIALSNLTAAGLTADEFQRQKDENAALVASIAANITEVNKYKDAWNAARDAAREALAIESSNSNWSVVGGRPVFANAGGMIPGYAAGGLLKYTSNEPPPGMMAGGVAGNGSRDSVAARLTPGEFVIRKSMVDKYGMPMLSSINQGSFSMPKYSMPKSEGVTKMESNNSTNISAPMYNSYSVGVNVSNAGASADEIANITIAKIKQMQGTQIRSGRGY